MTPARALANGSHELEGSASADHDVVNLIAGVRLPGRVSWPLTASALNPILALWRIGSESALEDDRLGRIHALSLTADFETASAIDRPRGGAG